MSITQVVELLSGMMAAVGLQPLELCKSDDPDMRDSWENAAEIHETQVCVIPFVNANGQNAAWVSIDEPCCWEGNRSGLYQRFDGALENWEDIGWRTDFRKTLEAFAQNDLTPRS